MDSLNRDNQADVIEAFNSTSRYLDDLLNIDNPYFEGMACYVPGVTRRLRKPTSWLASNKLCLKFNKSI